MGRPTTSPKTRILHMRMDEETVQKLKQAAEALDITMSYVVRKGIGLVHDSLKKWKEAALSDERSHRFPRRLA